jgi:F-type H+-transporting ATPase subunit b
MWRTAILLTLLLCLLLPVLPLHAAEAESEALELLFKWINFFTVFGALFFLLRKPFRRYVAERRRTIQAAIAESRKLHERAERQLAEVNERLARLEEQVKRMKAQAAADAAAEQRRIQESAGREAERILATARAEIDSTLRAGRLELKAYAARLAVNLAEQRIRRQLEPPTHAALFAAFVARLEQRRHA